MKISFYAVDVVGHVISTYLLGSVFLKVSHLALEEGIQKPKAGIGEEFENLGKM